MSPLLVAIAILMSRCSTQDLESTLTCNVSQDDKLTRYSVPEFQASSCHYYWSINASGHVLANHGNQTDECVSLGTNTALVTSQCFPVIFYSRSCITEVIERTAYCTTNCSGPLLDHLKSQGSRERWLLVVPALCAIVVVGIFAVIWRTRKNRESRTQRVHLPSNVV